MAEVKKERRLKDRLLGSEWADWDGSPVESPATAPALFLGIVFLIALGSFSVAGLLLWLLGLWIGYSSWPWLLSYLVYALGALIIFALLGLMVLSLLIDKNCLPLSFLRRPMAQFNYRLGRLLHPCGLSRDLMANSLVGFFNAAERRAKRWKGGEVLILIARCVSGEVRRQLLDAAARANFETSIVPSGEFAQEIVKRKNPRGIIAVACERDLVRGLRVVQGKVPVYCLTLEMPEGPCKDTLCELRGFYQAMELFGYRESETSTEEVDDGTSEA